MTKVISILYILVSILSLKPPVQVNDNGLKLRHWQDPKWECRLLIKSTWVYGIEMPYREHRKAIHHFVTVQSFSAWVKFYSAFLKQLECEMFNSPQSRRSSKAYQDCYLGSLCVFMYYLYLFKLQLKHFPCPASNTFPHTLVYPTAEIISKF